MPSPQVTVATYSEGEPAARLWQVYQVSPSLEKKVLPSGGWSPGTPASGTDAWSWLRDSLRSGESFQVKELTFGSMAAVTGDPLLRRSDLTGLHLACTTISVSWPQDALDRLINSDKIYIWHEKKNLVKVGLKEWGQGFWAPQENGLSLHGSDIECFMGQ